ncbi:MAG: photosynthetic complex assembly protein PuhC [Pseudomonadota bacterium]
MAHGRTNSGLYFDAEARTMKARDREMIPRRLVHAMFSLAVLSLVLTTLAVVSGRPLSGVPPVEPEVAAHDVVIDGEGNAAIVTTTEGEVLLDTEHGAFITVIRNGLETARRKHRVLGNPPVTITEYESGRMALFDPATGWQVELSSFGQGNLRHFRRLFNN